jgi:isoleucyl-tRNA synthetase
MTFEKVRPQVGFPALEREVLDLWERTGAFEKSVERRSKERPFVFYEGPPTANGRPGFHHALARAFKDLIPRYKTMQGYRVERKGGWDTHGLPVELQVEKELGLSGKDDVERYGVEEFNRLCRESVFRYVEDWRAMSERLGFWIDMDNPYRTLDNEYIESVWWALKTLYDKDLLYEGYKVSAHCPRDQTSLSAAEVALGYQQYPDAVIDPSVYVRLPLASPDEENTSLLVWTTTPWTLVSNAAVAAHPDVEYATAGVDGERVILARDLLDRVLGEDSYEVLETRKGSELEGLEYQRPFDYVPVEEAESHETLWTVVLGEHVTTIEGTGLVHTAPAYGEEDARLGQRYGLPTIHPVKPDGKFDERVGPFAGRFVKDADAGLVEELGGKGLLFRAEEYEHAYPHCWRCGTPLLYYAKRAWYARTTAMLDKLLSENEKINWVPEHVKWGRFGDWLRNNIDWALSRERYWGTPLPIWRTEAGDDVVVSSAEELKELAMDPVPDDLHRPYIDGVRIRHPETGEEAIRVPEVLDVWFDSGSMPFAQWAYPRGGEASEEHFEQQFPADYICEAVDQTRGWFYSLHAVSTMLFGRSSFKTCLVLGHILDAEGKKMSKSLGNVINPWDLFEKQGADALRWALYTATSPGNTRRFSEDQVDEAVRKHLLTLWNTYSFFVTYARIDGFDPNTDSVPPERRSLMDRWALGELQLTTQTVTERLDAYDVTAAGRAIGDFVDELSNWYVRRSRRRFWKGEDDLDKKAAHSTLYECLVAVAKLTAPFTPFVAEVLYQNLVVNVDGEAPESVHLADWPEVREGLIDQDLSERMAAARRVVALGRAARNAATIKTRQPLREVVIAPAGEDAGFRGGVESLEGVVLDELNVKELRFGEPEDVVAYDLKPNLGVVGPKYGRLVPGIREALAQAPPEVGARAASGEPVSVTVKGEEISLSPDELFVEPKEREGYALAREGDLSVALSTELDAELLDEGLVRELVHKVQNLRREQGLEIEESIWVGLSGSPRISGLLDGRWGDYFRSEVLARELDLEDGSPDGESLRVDGETLRVRLAPLGGSG